MGRRKRTSPVLETAQVRAAGIRNISATLDLGGGLTMPAYATAITDTQTRLSDYNQALAAADDKGNLLAASETNLKDLSERMLAGVGAHFGKNSSEYEQAGGVRKSDRKAASRKSKTPPATP